MAGHSEIIVMRSAGLSVRRLAGMVAIGMNFAFRGFWNGIGQSRRYLYQALGLTVRDRLVERVGWDSLREVMWR